MEARANLRETGVSKDIVVMLAVSVALALGTAGAVIATGTGGSSAAPAAHITQVTSGLAGPDSTYTVRRNGTESVEGAAAPLGSTYIVRRNGRQSVEGDAAAPSSPPAFRESHGY